MQGKEVLDSSVQSQTWILIVFAVGFLIVLFAGMFLLSYFKNKSEKQVVENKNRSKSVQERNTSNTRSEIIIFIEETYNKYKSYDERNIDSNVSKIKKEVKNIIIDRKNSDDVEEYELVNGSDDLIKLLDKLSKEPITVWKNFIEDDLRKVKENVK